MGKTGTASNSGCNGKSYVTAPQNAKLMLLVHLLKARWYWLNPDLIWK